ncbi:hypothetical protein Tco_1392741 [Tanacetum coccineum]
MISIQPASAKATWDTSKPLPKKTKRTRFRCFKGGSSGPVKFSSDVTARMGDLYPAMSRLVVPLHAFLGWTSNVAPTTWSSGSEVLTHFVTRLMLSGMFLSQQKYATEVLDQGLSIMHDVPESLLSCFKRILPVSRAWHLVLWITAFIPLRRHL